MCIKFPRAATINCHKLGSLYYGNLLSYNFGSQRSEIKVSADPYHRTFSSISQVLVAVSIPCLYYSNPHLCFHMTFSLLLLPFLSLDSKHEEPKVSGGSLNVNSMESWLHHLYIRIFIFRFGFY